MPPGARSVRGKHVVVTGGAGFIGSHLVDMLIEQQVGDLTIIDNFYLGKEENLAVARQSRPNLRVLRLDAADDQALEQAFSSIPPVEVVFDLAVIPLPTSLEHPKWCFDTNVRITSSLCELLRAERFETLIHFSSSEAYGSARFVPMTEEHPLDPLTPYAASKAGSDHLVRTYAATFGIDVLVVRPFNNYGPRQNDQQYAGIIPTLLRNAFEGRVSTIFGDGEQTRDYIYATDTASAVLQLYAHPEARGKVINIGSGQEISMLGLIAQLERIIGRPIQYEHRAPRPGDVRRHSADITLLKHLINFTPQVALGEGLERTVAFYRQRFDHSEKE